MAYELPSDGSSPKRLRTSRVASESPSASEIQEDEILLNAADGLLYFKNTSDAAASLSVASTSKVVGLTTALAGKVDSTTATAIVALTAAAYAALTPKVSTTLYIITDASAGATGVYLGSTVVASKAL